MEEQETAFVFENNFTYLTVIHPTTLEKLTDMLEAHPFVATLSLKAPVVQTPTNFKTLPPVRKLVISKDATTAVPIENANIIQLFEDSLVCICAVEFYVPSETKLKKLRYLTIETIYFHYKCNVHEIFPNLTHLHVPKTKLTFPCINVDTGETNMAEKDAQLYTIVLRNQKREKIALLVYWCLKSQLGKDIARILINYILSIPSTAWKLEELDIHPTITDKTVYLTRSYTIAKRADSLYYGILIKKNSLQHADNEISELEMKIIKTKRERQEMSDTICLLEAQLGEILERIKRHRTRVVDVTDSDDI